MKPCPRGWGRSLLTLGVAGLLASCVTTQDLANKTELVKSELETKIGKLDKTLQEADKKLEGLDRLIVENRKEQARIAALTATIDSDIRSKLEGDFARLHGGQEVAENKIKKLQDKVDNKSVELSAKLESLEQRLTGKLDDQASRQQAQSKSLEEQFARVEGRVEALDKRDAAALTVLGKKVDERLDAQDRRLEGEGKRTEGLVGQVGALQKDLGQTNEVVKGIGTKLSTQVEQQAVSLVTQAQSVAKLEEATRQADAQVRALAADVSRFQGVLQEFSKSFHILQNKSEEIGLRLAKLEARTEEKVGALVVQEGDRAARLEALRKQVEAEGQAMTAQVRELRAQADRQAAGLDAMEKTLSAVVATQNETSGSLGALKRVLEESVGKPDGNADVPPDIPTAPAQQTSITPEPPHPAGAVPRTAPESALSDKEAYELAKAQYEKGQWHDALNAFRQFTKKYRDSAIYVPAAHYYMAECHFKLGDYTRAIDEYEHVVKNYPQHQKAPGALLRKAEVLLEANDKASAKDTYKQLIEKYSRSEEAKKAHRKLAALK